MSTSDVGNTFIHADNDEIAWENKKLHTKFRSVIHIAIQATRRGGTLTPTQLSPTLAHREQTRV
jgi:hypothetical protein